MEWLLLLLAGLAAVAAVVVVKRRNAKKRREAARKAAQRTADHPQDPLAPDTSMEGDPLALKVGDFLDITLFNPAIMTGRYSFVVRGSVTITQGRYVWKEFFLDTGSGEDSKRWLSVEKDDGDVEVILWKTVPDNGTTFSNDSVTYDGQIYAFAENGHGTYVSSGTTDLLDRGNVEFYDYEGQSGLRLARERFDSGVWETSIGEAIDQGSWSIYPVR